MIVKVHGSVDKSFVISGNKIPSEETKIDFRKEAEAIMGTLLETLSYGTLKQFLEIASDLEKMDPIRRSFSDLAEDCFKSARECEIK